MQETHAGKPRFALTPIFRAMRKRLGLYEKRCSLPRHLAIKPLFNPSSCDS